MRRYHKEGIGQRPSVAIDRNLVLLHRLKQCALRLGRRSIDFVGEDQLGKNWAGLKFEFACALLKNRNADDIGGE